LALPGFFRHPGVLRRAVSIWRRPSIAEAAGHRPMLGRLPSAIGTLMSAAHPGFRV